MICPFCFTCRNDNDVEIRSDSRYVVTGVQEWLPRWQRTEFLGGRIANQDLWQQLHEVLQERVAAGKRTRWTWIKAHNANEGNERADELARQGIDVDQ